MHVHVSPDHSRMEMLYQAPLSKYPGIPIYVLTPIPGWRYWTVHVSPTIPGSSWDAWLISSIPGSCWVGGKYMGILGCLAQHIHPRLFQGGGKYMGIQGY